MAFIYSLTPRGFIFYERVLSPHNPCLHLKGSGKEPPSTVGLRADGMGCVVKKLR